jgi:aspartyl-tRNA(Asn)/glutamyl-tRNA(Gln) amidotransferase subunit B
MTSATSTATDFEAVIGLEVHAQVHTSSKMFCACSADYANTEPNTHVCPVCLGMPGAMPVMNWAAVEAVVKTALALDCRIPEHSKFDRKNYHYPDLMKGYQISQYDMPLSLGGRLAIEVEGVAKDIRVTRVHLEEDTARLLHRDDGAGGYSLVDVNRSGVPLMEIVSEPDARSGAEAAAYLRKLQQILRYLGVSHADMEKGSMRCEPNISLRPRGQAELANYKVEIKNLNSFRAVERAVAFEIERQAELLRRGERPPQETRGWDEDRGVTFSQRSKEFAHDYRYFPEPDLPPMVITADVVDALRAGLPELPDARRARFEEDYGLTPYEANLLSETPPRAEYFEAVVRALSPESSVPGPENAKLASNWVSGDLARLLNESGQDISETKVKPEALAEMIAMVRSGAITGRVAKDVIVEMFETGKPAKEIVGGSGRTQISAATELQPIVLRVMQANAQAVDDYRGGKEAALKRLVGAVMKETQGRANPQLAEKLLAEQIRAQG